MTEKSVDPAWRKAELIVKAARMRKAFDLVLLKVDRQTSIADYFFFASGRSTRQVQGLAENIRVKVKEEGGYLPLGVEGVSQGRWILMDYGEVVVHLFHDPVRELYDLESLWMDAPRIDLGPQEDELGSPLP